MAVASASAVGDDSVFFGTVDIGTVDSVVFTTAFLGLQPGAYTQVPSTHDGRSSGLEDNAGSALASIPLANKWTTRAVEEEKRAKKNIPAMVRAITRSRSVS